MSKPDPNDKRQRHVASVVQYLRIEFLAYDVAPFPEYRIKVRQLGRGKVIHEVAFHIAFLDDHDDPVKEVQRLGLVPRALEPAMIDSLIPLFSKQRSILMKRCRCLARSCAIALPVTQDRARRNALECARLGHSSGTKIWGLPSCLDPSPTPRP